MKVAVVGATGMVGEVMLKVLAERNFPITELLLVASERSVGKKLTYKNKAYSVIGLADAVAAAPDVAIFSAGGSTSLEWAPKFAEVGTTVIDNSSAWRMDPTKKLVVPEINAHELTKQDKIIANPNCSTIQMVLALAPLHNKYKMKRVVVSTYQSVSGTGVKAVQQLENEIAGIEGEMAYPYPIGRNALPHCDVFEDNGYTREEMKMVWETRKIFADDSIMVNPTAVRVPVFYGHSEAVHIETREKISAERARELLENTPGVIVVDEHRDGGYPTAVTEGVDTDPVYVGRIREDISHPNGLDMWVVADNVRKGAATNSIQIAEILAKKYL